MKRYLSAMVAVLLVACGGSEPSPTAVPVAVVPAAPAPPAPSTAMEKADSGPASPEPVAACTMTKALSMSCATCVKSRCCSPPVSFDVSKAQTLGCRMGCRKPLPAGTPVLGDSDRALVIKTCLAKCNDIFTESDEVTRLDGCIADRCNPECLSGG